MNLNAITLAITRPGGVRAARPWDPLYLFLDPSTQGVWYDPSDLTTLFQDAAGATPVTSVEQPVGLMLDKRDTAYSTYFDGTGDYLSTPDSSALNLSSGDFTIECWIYPQRNGIVVLNKGGVSGTYYPDYELAYTSSGTINFGIGGSFATWNSNSGVTTVPQNAWTHIAVVRSGNAIKSYINGVVDINTTYLFAAVNNARSLNIGYQPSTPSAQNWLGNISNLRIVKGTALYTANFTPPTAPLTAVPGTSLLTCGTSWAGNPAITSVGNTRADKLNPFKIGTGNHAYNQAGSSGSFPRLSALYNLLTKTEAINTSPWGGNATPSQTTAPDGTGTATMLSVTTTDTDYSWSQAFTSAAAQYKFSVFVKKTVGAATFPMFYIASDIGPTFGIVALNTNTGQLFDRPGYAADSKSSTDRGDYWEISFSKTLPASAGSYIRIFPAATQDFTTYLRYTGSCVIWHPDLRVSNDALNQPAYQRVNTSSDYDTVGFKPYLKFNGTNQWLQTNSIDFSYGDKMFVSAGVRKLADNAGLVFEFSQSYGTYNGAFAIQAGVDQGVAIGPYWNFTSKGTTGFREAASPASYVAPITSVLSGIGDIGGDKSILRINGAQSAIDAGDQGTGNYGNYPLYIGARAGSSTWFNGRLYQLVVAGKQATDTELLQTEDFMELKTFNKDMGYVYNYLVDASGNPVTDSSGNPIYVSVTYQ